MLTLAKSKFHNVSIDVLSEPFFVFSEKSGFRDCNVAAEYLLHDLGYSQKPHNEKLEIFAQKLSKHSLEESPLIVKIGESRYDLVTQQADDIVFLRLIPAIEDPNLVRLMTTFEMVPWGVLMIDVSKESNSITYCNERAANYFQTAQGNIMHQSVRNVFRVFGMNEDLTDKLYTSDRGHYDFETKQANKTVWYRFHFIPYRTNIDSCLVLIENTTDSKILEGQYFHTQRLESLGRLAGGVAHDFNNILSIVDGYARMGKKQVGGDSTLFTYLDKIEQAVQRGSALTSQLLTFGRHKISKDTVFDLGKLVKDQESLVRPLMDASITLNIRVEENVFISVPPDNICQILLNLCINSRDAMIDGGNLIVEVRKGLENDAILRVIDTGIGMNDEIKSRIFDPFYTTKDQGKGTGLGLSMVYGLVKDMKGEIQVLSKEGSGTSMTVHLPLSDKRPEIPEIIKDSDGNVQLKGFTAMVAEDEPELLSILSSTLEDIGIKVLKASNGNEALVMQDEYNGNIDFLLTDVVMPNLNGVKLAELFASVRPESKIMFMSGYPANGDLARVPLPEDALMMPKPINVEKLISILQDMASNAPSHEYKEKWKSETGQWRNA